MSSIVGDSLNITVARMNEKGIHDKNDTSKSLGGNDHSMMPITPFSTSFQTPASAGTVSSATCIRNRNISREEIIASEIAQTSALTDYDIHRPKPQTSTQHFGAEFVRNPDGTPLLDHENKPITIAKMLATKPLKSELHSRPGPGNRKLTYLSGDSVTRTLNDIFGFDGWCLEVKETRRECCEKDSKDRYCVSYTSLVRVTHRQSGAFKEDCGAGDCVDRSLGTAISHALKASVTDAMKRAVRHFGDKLGNSLYESSFNMNNAPKSLKDALIMYEIERAKCKFGFEKDRVKVEPNVERLQEEEYSVSTKENVHNTASVPQDANRSSAMDNGSSLRTETGATRPVPSIAGASGNLNPNHLARNNTNSTGALNPVAGGGYNYHVNHGNVRHQVSNTYKTNEIPNTKSSTSTVTNTAATITSSISSGPTIKNETIPQMHTLVNSSVTSNISPNGIKRFQNTNATTQQMPGANNNNFGDSLQPLPTVQIPSLPISNIYSRSHEPLTSSYATRNVLSDVTTASNSVPLPHGPINNSYCVNNAKRPVQDDQENSVLPGSKKAITTYSMSNPYMTTKK